MKKQQKLPPGIWKLFWKLLIGLFVVTVVWIVICILLGLPAEKAKWIGYGVIPGVATLLFWRKLQKSMKKVKSKK